MIKKIILFIFTSILTINSINAQKIDYANPKKYEIAEITIGGIKYLNHNALVQLSGLRVGQEINIPGDAITKAIRNLWKQGLFSDVKIYQTKIENKKVYLEIFLQERPKISEVIYTGLKKAHESDIVDAYIQRLKKLENIALEYEGVVKTYAIQAGRELRVIVGAEKVNDNQAMELSYDLSKKIQEEMTYPGQIKITVIRETRAINYAK